MSGLMAEYGPFFVDRNGTSLSENVYAWNKHYNMLFLESPLGLVE
jgi:carboxypeptidase C (cathepsin A)